MTSKQDLELAALIAGAALISYRIARGANGLAAAARPVAVPELPDRRLYLSLDGTERREWKGALFLMSAGLFGAGFLAGKIVSRQTHV